MAAAALFAFWLFGLVVGCSLLGRGLCACGRWREGWEWLGGLGGSGEGVIEGAVDGEVEGEVVLG